MKKGHEWALALGCIAGVAGLLTLATSSFLKDGLQSVKSLSWRPESAPEVDTPVWAPPPPMLPAVAPGAAVPQAAESWITSDDYPAEALRYDWQGTTAMEWTVDKSGRATDCVVTKSSGYAALDEASCALILSRARYAPAMDGNGNPITSKDKRRVVWRLPEG